MRKTLSERYVEAKQLASKDDGELRNGLLLAAGFLLAGDMPGSAAAVELAYRRLFPGAEFPTIAP